MVEDKRARSLGRATKLDEATVRAIKRELADPEIPVVEIAEKYGVHRDTIYKIERGLRWAWVS